MKAYKTVLFLMVLSTICTLFLSTAQFTYGKLSVVFNRRLYGVILNMYGYDWNEDNVEEIFYENFETASLGSGDYFISRHGETRGNIIFRHEGPGLWSQIEILLSLNPNRDSIYKMAILSQAETPGLGARIVEEPFLAQFEGVKIRPELNIVKFSSRDNEVDAISGATNTSQFLQVIINKAVLKQDSVFGTDKSIIEELLEKRGGE